MPSGMTTTGGQRILNSALYEHIFSEDIRTLGPAIAAAKQTLLANGSIEYEQISKTFLLFGDPATVLKVPLPHMPTGVSSVHEDDAVHLRWDAVLDCNDQAVAGYNIYRASTAAGPFSKINSVLITDTTYVEASGGGQESTYYYRVTSVDTSDDESAQSIAVSPAALNTSSGSSGGGGGCFISSANSGFLGSENPEKILSIRYLCVSLLLCIILFFHCILKYSDKNHGKNERRSA
jgi:preprotein translocase subunit SecG